VRCLYVEFGFIVMYGYWLFACFVRVGDFACVCLFDFCSFVEGYIWCLFVCLVMFCYSVLV